MIDEAREREKFEKWFKLQDPEPEDPYKYKVPYNLTEHQLWIIRKYNAELGWLGAKKEANEEIERLRLELDFNREIRSSLEGLVENLEKRMKTLQKYLKESQDHCKELNMKIEGLWEISVKLGTGDYIKEAMEEIEKEAK